MPEKSTKPLSLSVRLFGCAILGGVLYLTLTLALLLFSIYSLKHGRVYANPVLLEYERAVYMVGLRRIWQTEPGCLQFDPKLLYVPGSTPCRFENPEFKTVLHFDAKGRVSPHPKGERGIAVLGDSHAMGWGVGDDATFAAVLERSLGRPVYNLAVASYGTYRELQRLEESGLVDSVDTVIIQYCDNDLPENQEKLRAALPSSPEQFEAFDKTYRMDTSAILKGWVVIALRLPLSMALAPLRPTHFKDFAPDYAAIQAVFARFPWIQDKKVLLFYSNQHGQKFSNFSEVVGAPKPGAPRFVDLPLEPGDYYLVDDHLTEKGHQKVASFLEAELKR